MPEIKRRVLIKLPVVLGVDISVTNEVLLLWIAAAVTFIVLFFAFRRREAVPRGSFQNLFEALAEFIDRQVVQGSMGDAGRHWASLLLTLFFFILFGNLLGLVPLPTHFKPATANLNVTAALASIVFTVVLALNLRRHGLLGFLKKFVPPGLPWGVALLVAPVEVLSWLAKPVSLAIRLFANMMAGHALIFVFVAMEMSAAWLLVPFPVVGAVIMNCFEIFVCFIQAFVFTLLAGIYIRDAMEEAA